MVDSWQLAMQMYGFLELMYANVWLLEAMLFRAIFYKFTLRSLSLDR